MRLVHEKEEFVNMYKVGEWMWWVHVQGGCVTWWVHVQGNSNSCLWCVPVLALNDGRLPYQRIRS